MDWTIGYRYQNREKFYLFNNFGNIDFPEGLHLFVIIGNKCHNNAIGGDCESRGFDARLANGELMPGSELLLIVQSLELVPFCRRILKPYNTEMQSSEKLAFVHWKCEISFRRN